MNIRINNNDENDIKREIMSLAKSYLPQWHFSEEDPDIGSVIAILFASMMKENINLENHIPEKYYAEFINMLDLTLNPPIPSQTIVCFNLMDLRTGGGRIEKGTRIVAEGDKGEVVFSTDNNLYVTSAQITDMFMTDGEEGTVVPLLGEFKKKELAQRRDDITELPDQDELEEETEPLEEEKEDTGYYNFTPFTLFCEEGGIAVNSVGFFHESVFDTQGNPLYLRLAGNSELSEDIARGDYEFKYFTKNGWEVFDSVELMDDKETFRLIKSKENEKTVINEKEYSAVSLTAKSPVKETVRISSVEMYSTGSERNADFVSDGNNDLDPENFDMFSDTLSTYAECYIGNSEYFSKNGARITLTFDVSFPVHAIDLNQAEIEEELKVIKKKPRNIVSSVMSDAYADEISIEYFNGIGWKTVKCESVYKNMFAAGQQGQYSLSFLCPSDWAQTEVGSFRGRSLRIELLRSENCFIRPCRHHYPRIKDLKISYSYEKYRAKPQRSIMISGTDKKDITLKLNKGETPVFIPSRYMDDALYLGLDRKIEEGPASLLFVIRDGFNKGNVKCRFEYSSMEGFKQMKILDETNEFSKSGVVLFMPESDMHEMTLEGRKRFWIRIIRDVRKVEGDVKNFMPDIEDIKLNAMTASNIVSGPEEDYFLEEVGSGMRFALYGSGILDANVWVNEYGSLSKRERDKLKEENPSIVREEFDISGNVTAFYVKWEETRRFDGKIRRSYMIDRLTNEIVFSDGVHEDIPRVLNDVAFKVSLRMTAGGGGNVPARSPMEAMSFLPFVDYIYSPVKAFGGSDLETVKAALKRGTNIFHSRNRLVSADDYVNMIKAYSDNIDKVSAVVGQTIYGVKNPAAVSFVLLMKDFMYGSYSFHKTSAVLKDTILESCEYTIGDENLFITEPMFVYISVTVWTEIMSINESFEVQNSLNDALNRYLDPVSSDTDPGWEIGMMPKKSQILMRLNVVNRDMLIKKTAIVARYTDIDGTHEMDLDDLQITPFMICRNGEHKVHVMVKQ